MSIIHRFRGFALGWAWWLQHPSRVWAGMFGKGFLVTRPGGGGFYFHGIRAGERARSFCRDANNRTNSWGDWYVIRDADGAKGW